MKIIIYLMLISIIQGCIIEPPQQNYKQLTKIVYKTVIPSISSQPFMIVEKDGQKKSNRPYVVIKKDNQYKEYFTLSLLSFDINLNQLKTIQHDVSKRIFYNECIFDISSTIKPELYSSPIIVSCISSEYQWKKELPFSDIVTNKDGIYAVSNENITKIDITNGNYIWQIQYSEILNNRNDWLKFYVCDSYIIIHTNKGEYYHINTINGELSKINLSTTKDHYTIINCNGFIYNNNFYYIDKNYFIIKFPDFKIMNIKDKIDIDKFNYITMYKDNVIIQSFIRPLFIWNTDISDKFSIFKSNIDLLSATNFPEGKVVLYTNTGENKLDLNKINNNNNISVIVIDEYLLIYSKEKVVCVDDKEDIKWVYNDENKGISYEKLNIIWVDEKQVVFIDKNELVVYETP